jgi:hypothetical protein
MMQSTSRRRCRKTWRSDAELTPADRLSFEVEPSAPTTSVATMLTRPIIAQGVSNFLKNLSVATFTFKSMIIDCNTCTMATIACNTCVVAFFLEPSREISEATVSALTVLADSGLTPPLQYDARGA